MLARIKEFFVGVYKLFVLPPEFYYHEEKVKLHQQQDQLRQRYWRQDSR